MTSTPNLELVQPAYNSTGWHTAINGNFAIIDAALSQFFVQANFTGIWLNSTAYAIDDVVVDSTTSNTYKCLVNHTSAASPTTFSTDRTNNPTYWENTTIIGARGMGTWTTATDYIKGDFVVDSGVYAVCTASHTSGATFAGDAAYWSELIDLSGAIVADGSIDGAKFADPLTIPGATEIEAGGLTVTAGGVTITAGGLTVVANATILQGTTIQSGGLTVTTGGITVSAGGITVTGNSTITGTLSGLTGFTIASGGFTVTGNSTITGTLSGLTGLTVTSGGANITGNSTITGTLGGLTGLTIASGGYTVTGNCTITGTLGGLTGLTVVSGGASITGNSSVTGTFGVSGAFTVSANGANITGNSTITGDLDVTGNVDAATLSVGASGITFSDMSTQTTAPVDYDPAATLAQPLAAAFDVNTGAGTLLFKAGTIATSSGSISVSFAAAFPTAIISVNVSGDYSGAPPLAGVRLSSVTVSGFTAHPYDTSGNNQDCNVYWFAVGY